MKRRYEAISILTSEDGKTIGAKLQAYDNNGWICRFSTKQLRENKDKIEIVNAIIDDRGYVRSRSGELRKEKIITNKSNVYYIMCKDIKVCVFNRNTGEASIIRDDLLPLDIYLEDGELADRFNNKVVFDAAKEIVNKYKIVLKPLHEYNEYYKFVNDRIKLLGL